jgi:hypothetical protein
LQILKNSSSGKAREATTNYSDANGSRLEEQKGIER